MNDNPLSITIQGNVPGKAAAGQNTPWATYAASIQWRVH